MGGALMIGGRSFDPAVRPRLRVAVGPLGLLDETLTPGAFLEIVDLPNVSRDAAGLDYLIVRVEATGGGRVAVEQFDASASRPIFGFGDGWHEQEFNPRTGMRWRWLSARGELKVGGAAMDLRRLTLHLEGESPRTMPKMAVA